MSIQQLVGEVKGFFENVLNKEAHIIGVEKSENGWRVKVETVEDSEYMRRRALNDTMALYEVELNENLEILSYKRLTLRQRDEIQQEDED